jgi:putative ABC transport system permease protein
VALGIYALIAYPVNRRTQEFGIRMAIGAGALDLQGRVLIGVAASLFMARSLTALLFGITATDPVTFAPMVVVLRTVAGVAGHFPARRASRIDPRIDPAIALRGN